MSLLTLGTRLVSGPSTYLTVGGATLNQRAISHAVFTAPDGLWVTHMGMWLRSAALDPDTYVVYGIWARDEDGEPTTLLARTAALLLPTVEADVGGPLVWTNPAYAFQTPQSLLLLPGERVLPGFLIYGGSADVGAVFGSTAALYMQTVATEMVTNPFLGSSVAASQTPALYLTAQSGSTPSAPAITAPIAGQVLSNLVPTFTGTFADSDTSVYGDGLRQYQLEVREFGTTVAIWTGAASTFVASTAETAAAAFSRVYDGPALLNGHTYEVRARVADATGDWSPFSAWVAFSFVAALAVDTSDATPNDKVDGNSATIAWSARWWQVASHNADRLKLRVLDGGVVIKQSAEIVQSVVGAPAAPGTPFTISAASAGIGALTPGRAYTFQIQARDGTTLEWSAWSLPVAFRTNALPTVPVITAPPSGAVSAGRPEIRFISFDPDADDIEGTGVTWEVEYLEVAVGGTRVGQATAFNPAANEVSVTPTATEMPNPGTYRIRARGFDVSAGDFGRSDWSAPITLTYTAGPSFTLTTPTHNEVLATLTPTATWVAVGQTSYRVRLYTPSGALWRDSAVIAGSAQSFVFPAGWLANLGTYDLQVESWVGATLSLSPRVRITIDLAAVPAPTSVLAARVDLISQAVRVSWGPTTLPSGEFVAWIVSRWVTSAGQATAVDVTTIPNPAKLFHDDTGAPSNTLLSYGVRQRRLTPSGNRDSSVTVAPQTVAPALQVPVIAAIGDASLFFPVMWLREGLSGEIATRRSSHQTWGAQGKSFVVTAPGGSERLTITVTLRNDDRGTMMGHFNQLKALVKSGRPVIYRGEDPAEVFTMGFSAPMRWQRGDIVGTREVTLQLEEIAS